MTTGVRVAVVPQVSMDEGVTWVEIGEPILGWRSSGIITTDSGRLISAKIPDDLPGGALQVRFEVRFGEIGPVLGHIDVHVGPIVPGMVIELKPVGGYHS